MYIIVLLLFSLQVKAQENQGSLFCDICQIHCTSPDLMKDHIASKKHQVDTDKKFFESKFILKIAEEKQSQWCGARLGHVQL